jgi:hypothetical protein
MFFLGVATFYVVGDVVFNAYTVSRAAVWVLVGLAAIEVYAKVRS